MVLAAVFIVFAFALMAIHVLLKNQRILVLMRQFPGPDGAPIIGNAISFIGSSPVADVLKYTADHRHLYGRISRLWALRSVEFLITDPKVLEIVMSNSKKFMGKSRMYGVMRPWLGDGLLLSTGQKWHKRRKIITPAFHFGILKQFAEIFEQQSRILVSRLSSVCDGCAVDIYPFASKIALDVVCETAMGVQINAQTDSESEYVKAVEGVTEAMSHRLATLWLRNEIVFWLFGGECKRNIDKYLRVLHSFSSSIILKRREELVKKMTNSKEPDAATAENERMPMALLDVLLQSTIDGQSLSNEDIREEVDTFMFEGHDTTTIGIAFTLYTISRHKSVQDRLFAEIRSVCGDDPNDPVSYHQLNKMKYIDSVIKESLRLYPPVPGISRNADADIRLDDGRIIPEGAVIHFILFNMFRDPDYFPQPTKFDPDRFVNGTLDDKVANKSSPFAYIPFSAGTRNCIGQKYAMLEMKCVISTVLRHFELLPVGDEPDLRMEMVLRTKNGVQLGLKLRIY